MARCSTKHVAAPELGGAEWLGDGRTRCSSEASGTLLGRLRRAAAAVPRRRSAAPVVLVVVDEVGVLSSSSERPDGAGLPTNEALKSRAESCRPCWCVCRSARAAPAQRRWVGATAGHRVDDDRAPVAALRHEARVSDPPHELDVGLPDAHRIPAGRGRLARELVPRHRRDHHMERVGCARPVRGGILLHQRKDGTARGGLRLQRRVLRQRSWLPPRLERRSIFGPL